MIDAYEAFALIGRFVSNLFEAWCLGFSAPPGMDGYSSVVFMASRVLFFPMAFFIIIAIVIGGATLVMEKINASKKRTEAEKQKA